MLGHNIWVLYPAQDSTDFKFLTPFNLSSIDLGLLKRYWGSGIGRLFFSMLAGTRILRLHPIHHFEVIHGHGDIFEAFVLKQFTKRLGIPLVMTIHSGLSRRHYYRWIARRVWRMADGIIAVSQDIAQDLENLEVHHSRLAVISSGVELSHFSPVTEQSRHEARRALGISETVFVITSVGRLTRTKGFEHLIKATQILTDMDSIQIYIVGDGPLRPELEFMARGTGNVRLTGSKPHDLVRRYLHAADLFVIPFVDQAGVIEGMPTSVMEAMATGLPVITTDSGGAKYAIEVIPDVTVVSQGDSQALANAILRFAKDSELRKHIGELNRERVMCRDWPRITSDVCQFYERIMTLPKG